MAAIDFTPKIDLRTGHPCWIDLEPDAFAPAAPPKRCEILVVGAGITGALIAERLSRDGRTVAVVDRRTPATGSTAASTALVMWAADTPLSVLAESRGNSEAEAVWQRVFGAVRSLDALAKSLPEGCGWHPRDELYLAGSLLDEAGLTAEAQARGRGGLPSTFLSAQEVAARFGLPPRAALHSTGCYSVDPVAMTVALLERAQHQGMTLSFPFTLNRLEQGSGGIVAHFEEGGCIAADQVVLATGYEASRLFLPEAFALGSTFAIATPPDAVDYDGPMLWEASDPYLYLRSTVDGRIILGGEDITGFDPHTRDALLMANAGRLSVRGGALLGRAPLPADYAWAATFGRSPDGLPAIGRSRNAERVWLAAGFGGNGISFSAVAAEAIARGMAGEADEALRLFDPYRFEPPSGRS